MEKLPGVMATDEAFVIFQERVEVTAMATTPGDAPKEEMDGVEEEDAALKVPTTIAGKLLVASDIDELTFVCIEPKI